VDVKPTLAAMWKISSYSILKITKKKSMNCMKMDSKGQYCSKKHTVGKKSQLIPIAKNNVMLGAN
jgi:uncharacterized protein YfaQ (DUF2300 family)